MSNSGTNLAQLWTHRISTLLLVVVAAGGAITFLMFALGWLLTATIPGCWVGEDGAGGCHLLGMDINTIVYITHFGGLLLLLLWSLFMLPAGLLLVLIYFLSKSPNVEVSRVPPPQ